VISPGLTEVPIVMLETDEGINGIAVGSIKGVDGRFTAIERQDPRAVSALYDRMLAQVFKAGHGGATYGGIGTLDSAIWDLKANRQRNRIVYVPPIAYVARQTEFRTGYKPLNGVRTLGRSPLGASAGSNRASSQRLSGSRLRVVPAWRYCWLPNT
jgi:hypothetical protein